MKDDHGLSIDDLEFFQSNILAEALELAWQCEHMPYEREKVELALHIVDMLSQAYRIAMWADATLENPQASFDSPKPLQHQLYAGQR